MYPAIRLGERHPVAGMLFGASYCSLFFEAQVPNIQIKSCGASIDTVRETVSEDGVDQRAEKHLPAASDVKDSSIACLVWLLDINVCTSGLWVLVFWDSTSCDGGRSGSRICRSRFGSG